MDTWPTAEQFDAAAEQGSQAALDERRSGAEGPRESPLNGEFAGAPTPRDVAYGVGFPGKSMDDLTDDESDDYISAEAELADAWERGYFDTWAHEDAVQAEEDQED